MLEAACVVLLIVAITVFRFLQFYRCHVRCVASKNTSTMNPLVVMLDHYHGTEEFESRLTYTL